MQMKKAYITERKQSGSWTGKLDPQELGEYLRSLDPEERTPRNLYEKAKSPKNPFHKHLDWDDKSASEKYRITQIRNIVMVISIETKEGPLRDFINLRIGDHREYFTGDEIVADKILLDQALKQIVNEMVYFKNKYAKYRIHFEHVFRAMDKTVKKWSKKDEK